MLARVLKKLGLKSEDFVIATKGWSFSRHGGARLRSAAHPPSVRTVAEEISSANTSTSTICTTAISARTASGWRRRCDARCVGEGRKNSPQRNDQSAYNDADFQRAMPAVRPTVLQSWAQRCDLISQARQRGRQADG